MNSIREKYRYDETEVLNFSDRPKGNSTVRRYYERWRQKQGIPIKCDNPKCQFNKNPLEWNGQKLALILDHKSGNRNDNTQQNLRLLCPNCDSQLPTRGGANKNRTQNETKHGYETAHRDGTRDVNMFLGFNPRWMLLT